MFYSHTLLARKSPLGTIWLAAHHDNKIQRRQIESIHVPSSAEKIMMPDVPIALRLSGHLLFGLVRIQSWKANNLFSDYNRFVTSLRKAIALVSVDLPIEADCAPIESVTLPETFDLNALEFDETYYRMNEPDKHLKSYDQITMLDQIPMEAEQYVAVSISEDGWLNLSPRLSTGLNQSPQPTNVVIPTSQPINVMISTPQPAYLSSVSMQLENDTLPAFEGGLQSFLGHQDQAIFNENALSENETHKNTHDGNNTSQENSDFEKICHSDNLYQGIVASGDFQTGQQSTQTINKRQALSTISEDISVHEGGSSFHAKQLDSVSTNKHIPEPKALPEIPTLASNIKSVSPAKRRRAKKKKRACDFDMQVVLSNMQMKNQLNNTSNIVCKKRKLPCSDLAVWKFGSFSRKNDIFCFPLLSGMDPSLFKIFDKTYPCSVDNNIKNLKQMEGPAIIDSPPIDSRPIDSCSDIDRIRDTENIDPNTHLNPIHFSHSGSEPLNEKSPEKHSGPVTSPIDHVPLNLEDPLSHSTELHLDDTAVPEVPGFLAAKEDLNFLNENDSSPGNKDAFQVENLSARTRSVAKYFKDKALGSHSDESEHVSLNIILEHKSRKQSARLFFETLVLKSNDFIKVKQKEAYGDILISPTPALFSTKF